MEATKLKELILLAQEIRETSWIVEETNQDGRCIKGHYAKNHFESAKQATEQMNINSVWIQVVYLINYHAWNDIQEWKVGD